MKPNTPKKADEDKKKVDEAKKKAIEAKKKIASAEKKVVESQSKVDEAKKKVDEAKKKVVEAKKNVAIVKAANITKKKKGGSTMESSVELDRLKIGQQIGKLENQVERLSKSINDEIDNIDRDRENNWNEMYDEQIVIREENLGEYFSARREIEEEIKLLKKQV